MEDFMTRQANKLSAQEMIKANEAAEAARRQQIEDQNKQYEKELEVLQQNAQKLEGRLDSIETAIEDLNKRIDASDEATHDVGVRIYRNVQASVADEQKKQLDEIKENMQKQMDGIRGEFSVLLRRLDTTRNQLEEQYRDNSGQKTKGLLPLVVIVLLISIADIVINILRVLGLV
jgi:chaperonin cofactor prefoldin